ncbi:hypothetical protein, partial [Fusobacterium sp.]|uniref:hypothetical protein n=1 Tax=Fusobacterium sp. TaxID=68766 RepID=UPI0026060831
PIYLEKEKSYEEIKNIFIKTIKKTIYNLKKMYYIVIKRKNSKTKWRIKIKRKGSVLIEFLVIIGITFLCFVTIFIKYDDINQQKDLENAVDTFETIVYKYANKSMATRTTFDIKFDYRKKEIIVNREGSSKEIEKIELPKKLKYGTVYNGIMLKELSFSTKASGNLSKAFSVYVCDYSENAKYRVAYYNFQQSRILKINIYKNVRAGKIKYKELEKYHYNMKEDEVKEGWEKR